MKKFNINTAVIVSILFIIVIGLGIYFIITKDSGESNEKVKEEKQSEITKLDINSTTRPFAVMINNHSIARANHAGLQDAYIVYEMIVEGGITRLMAIFKDVDVEKIGSVRSARPYFLDYALENDAIYVHWGGSPQALSDINSLRLNDLDCGNYKEGTYCYRDFDLNVAYEHTGFTNTEMLKKVINDFNYAAQTSKPMLLDYSAESVDYSDIEGVKNATKVSIKYSGTMTASYEYDEDEKVYKRFANGQIHKDAITGKQYTFKNIITYQVYNSTILDDDKGRQDFDNIGSGTGYLITEGKSIPIKWQKNSRSEQTKYTYFNGEEIVVNNGNTFIQIQPKNQDLIIE